MTPSPHTLPPTLLQSLCALLRELEGGMGIERKKPTKPTRTLCDPDARVADDEHKHQCPVCATTWMHEDAMQNASEAEHDEGHTCPKCNTPGVYEKHYMRSNRSFWPQRH